MCNLLICKPNKDILGECKLVLNSFILFHHLPILFLHIEHLYKVGDGNLLG